MTYDAMTLIERHVDELIRWETLERHTQQSRDTKDGERAEPPERPRLEAFVR